MPDMTAGAPKVAKTSNRGSKPGERRGGRTKGVPNKATASIRDIARQYTEEAVNGLVAVLRDLNEPAAARVSEANSILDRRSEERRVGEGCVSTCRYRWAPNN